MKQVILRTIKKYNLLEKKNSVVVAVSGGADSMALLHLLLEIREIYNLHLVVAHVNHKKRTNSDLDEELVVKIAKQYNVPYEVYHLPKQEGNENFHEYARRKRYCFFKSVANKYNASYLATAHHADDHLETQVFRLIYQSTLQGLIGIEPISQHEELKVIRPLIELTKEQVYQYCHDQNVLYREDESNQSDGYTRNRIRKYVVPALKQESHSVYQHSRSISEQLSEDEKYFSSQVDSLMLNVIQKEGGCEVSRDFIRKLPNSLSKRLIKRILQQFTLKDIQTTHIEDILELVQNKKPNLSLILPHQISCVIAYDVVQFSTILIELERYELTLEMDSSLVLPQGAVIHASENKVDEKTEKFCINKVHLCYNEIELPLKVRTRKPGDRITLMNGYGTKKVKEIMIESKIPKHLRETWPIVTDSADHIIWIPLLKKSTYCHHNDNGRIITIEYCHLGGNEKDA